MPKTIKKDLDVWFYSLGLDALMRIFRWSKGDANDFIDDCDEAWGDMSLKEREDIYNHFNDWF